MIHSSTPHHPTGQASSTMSRSDIPHLPMGAPHLRENLCSLSPHLRGGHLRPSLHLRAGHLRPSLRPSLQPSLRPSLQLYLHPSPHLPPHSLRETVGSDLRNHRPVIRSEVIAQGLVRPPKTASHEKEEGSFLLEQNESTASVKWGASTSTMRSASVNSRQR